MRIEIRRGNTPFSKLRYVVPTIFILSLLITGAIIFSVWGSFAGMSLGTQIIFGAGLLLLAFFLFVIIQAIFAVLFAKVLIGMHMRRIKDMQRKFEEASKRRYA